MTCTMFFNEVNLIRNVEYFNAAMANKLNIQHKKVSNCAEHGYYRTEAPSFYT